MHASGRRRDLMLQGDEPPFLTEGTEVSAKYKGAFCEAKVRKVVHSVKCRVTLKGGGTTVVQDDQIKGVLLTGANVEVKLPDKKDFVEATIVKIQDCSQYTVVFDDGDITTLRRTALCLKSGRHFAEGDTLDKLPLTHPEHFSNPVVHHRRGRRSRQAHDDSLDEESSNKGKKREEREVDIRKVVCVEVGDKKKVKDNWFPGLVVEPTAQDTVKINVKDEYLVRSFKDGRYYTVPKKEASVYTKAIGEKVENHSLKAAIEKAELFMAKDELPPHWDRDLLFGIEGSDDTDSEGSDSECEKQEDKDQFVAKLFTFMEDFGSPINNAPTIYDEDVDLHKLFKVVERLGGYNKVTGQNQWKVVTQKLNFINVTTNTTSANLVKNLYKKYLHGFEDFNRKLGCTMQSSPISKSRRRTGGRSIIRERDRSTPIPKPLPAEKEKPVARSPTPKVAEKKTTEKKAKKSASAAASTDGESSSKKARSERLQNRKDDAGSKKRLWKDDSQSDTEGAGPSSAAPAAPAAAPVVVKAEPPALTPEPKVVAKRKVETEESSDDDEQKDKRDKRIKTRTTEEESKKKSGTPDRKSSDGPPVREEKKVPAKPKSKDGDDSSSSTSTPSTANVAKKRGRKRKESEKVEELACLSSDIQVQVGDKLKVYYGPQEESKVTYEAKVIEVDSAQDLYMVHYTGWNTRYDEWVPRARIASNLSWTPARAKRTGRPSTNASPLNKVRGKIYKRARKSLQKQTSVGSSSAGPGRPSRAGKESSTRSTTPSSVTSSSSRTKSPAAGQSSRAQRAVKRSERQKRPRRTSGGDDKYSDSESDESDEEEDSAPPPTPRGARLRRDSTPRVKKIKEEPEEEEEDDEDDEAKESDAEERKEKDKGSEEDDEQGKGRDFNLSQLRSEMRGFDKAVKSSEASSSTDAPCEPQPQESTPPKSEPGELFSLDDDDIYEFKEPEPFKPETRLKLSDEKLKKSPATPTTPKGRKKKESTSSIDLPEPEKQQRGRRAAPKPSEDSLDWSAGSADSFKSLSPSYEAPAAASGAAPAASGSGRKQIYASTDLFGDPHSGQEDDDLPAADAACSSPLPFELDSSQDSKKDEAALKEERPEVEGEEEKGRKDSVHETIERVVQQSGDEPKKPSADPAVPAASSSASASSSVAAATSAAPEPALPAKLTLLKAVPIAEVKNLTKDAHIVTAGKIKVEDLKKTALMAGKGGQISFLVQTVAKRPEPCVPNAEEKKPADPPPPQQPPPPPPPPQVVNTKPLQSWKSSSRELCKSLRKEPRKKALKKTVSKEFIDDDDSSSDSDSSEELKLVIDRLEESGQDTSDSDASKKHQQRQEEEESSLNSLLCEETIPGSPVPGEEPKKASQEAATAAAAAATPKVRELPFASVVAGGSDEGPSTSASKPSAANQSPGGADEKHREESDAATVMQNTPPTTPDTSASASPSRDQNERSPKQDSGKSEQELSELELDSPTDGNKGESEDSLLNVDVGCESPSGNKGKSGGAAAKKAAAAAKDGLDGKKPKRRSRKEVEPPAPKRARYSGGRAAARNLGESLHEVRRRLKRSEEAQMSADAASDSDDNAADNTNLMSISIANTDNLLANQPSRPSRYNFYAELDPTMEGSQRITLLQTRMQELRKTYMNVKAELAFIDRRRKKLRRKEREGKSAAGKAEVWCAT
ncbi:AT-rich interactive domain-containing protein 4B isoform X1 [Cloeon dipterum]|uniref:AT-rich interactive domain-containing protein 4B isoform X1 n=1 Tax=Cloeon dipterum TaxID=197152 RepID=UPI00321F7401